MGAGKKRGQRPRGPSPAVPPGQKAGAEKDGGGNKEQKADAGKSRDDGKGGMGGGQQAADKKAGGAEGMQSAAKAKGDDSSRKTILKALKLE